MNTDSREKDRDEKTLEQIMKKDEEQLQRELGRAVLITIAPTMRLAEDYGELGREAWSVLQSLICDKLCDRQNKTPRAILKKMLSGEAQGIAIALLAWLKREFPLSDGIAIRATALLMKTKLESFCLRPPNAPKTPSWDVFIARVSHNLGMR